MNLGDAKRHELAAAFGRHVRAYEQAMDKTASHWLLLYYAVECGLKLCILRQDPRRKSTADLPDELRSHHINLLLREAGYPGETLKSVRVDPAGRSAGTVPPELVHELWRYGVDANRDDCTRTVEKLERIVAWLRDVVG